MKAKEQVELVQKVMNALAEQKIKEEDALFMIGSVVGTLEASRKDIQRAGDILRRIQ